ncbi:hypothetical protein NPIL_651871 [Nephila pilipes]|uniref:Uncharacterized protein n=1 Tax=Nephila pilipes TaxID=299642 RepID=A0A8X6P9R4_NEPPI|nr:hypothetical protein NPIL_651871 [Nephila pilipes]
MFQINLSLHHQEVDKLPNTATLFSDSPSSFSSQRTHRIEKRFIRVPPTSEPAVQSPSDLISILFQADQSSLPAVGVYGHWKKRAYNKNKRNNTKKNEKEKPGNNHPISPLPLGNDIIRVQEVQTDDKMRQPIRCDPDMNVKTVVTWSFY